MTSVDSSTGPPNEAAAKNEVARDVTGSGEPAAATAAPRRRRRMRLQTWLGDEHGLRVQLLRGGLVGAGAGLASVAFQFLLRQMERLHDGLLDWGHSLGLWGLPLVILILAAAAALAVLLTQRLAPEAAGSGIPHVMAVLLGQRQLSWQRVLPTKLLCGLLALGSGLSVGREGPSVQMGAAMAQAISRLLRLPAAAQPRLLAAGAGAGLAAAFNAPLAGFVFALEELQREMSRATYAMALLAAVVADVLARRLMGQETSFHVHTLKLPPLAALPLFILLGICLAPLGIAFNSLLLALLRRQKRRLLLPGWALAALMAALIGALAWWIPQLSGAGYASTQLLLAGLYSGGGLAAWLLLSLGLRFVLTIFSYASGVPGGVFAPLLAMGASAGALLGLLSSRIPGATQQDLTAFAVVGMAAMLAAVIRSPLTGVVLVLEMTGNYSLLLPLMAAAVSAYLVADRIRSEPLYEALLELDLGRPLHRSTPEVNSLS